MVTWHFKFKRNSLLKINIFSEKTLCSECIFPTIKYIILTTKLVISFIFNTMCMIYNYSINMWTKECSVAITHY